MATVVAKWGNAVGVRIPAAYLDQTGISVGDRVEFSVQGDLLGLKKAGPSLQELMENCSALNSHDEQFTEAFGEELL
ncbi:TPA: AbrB/MazE/SpoVT family DNA-binding domain-containing protein [Klebsiella oxytoca]|uniref:AbrB/MazE/SpoVT family DNA-binding domain-containing protein n=1 Tax=Klebsiella oxytoca TaxID=571 RepID=UPI00190E7B78|nr:AbrB/MazE/SpoVT family DNA-binding domain-containing protein [Klebsiella oxytoca]HBM3111080.1 AbrB/MazE/SpoVT family DNA-binding domain-containing protein [Klebsiella oxytoca]HCQ8325362.1 AbrB/MazE/SpoVT family DNA-binding domain-containing protein [Klebsiella oxytoca]